MTAWDIQVAGDSGTFSRVGSATCTAPGTCSNLTQTTLPAGTTARYVRIVPTTVSVASNGTYASIREFEAFAGTYTLSLPDANSAAFCNYTGEARDMALRVTK